MANILGKQILNSIHLFKADALAAAARGTGAESDTATLCMVI